MTNFARNKYYLTITIGLTWNESKLEGFQIQKVFVTNRISNSEKLGAAELLTLNLESKQEYWKRICEIKIVDVRSGGGKKSGVGKISEGRNMIRNRFFFFSDRLRTSQLWANADVSLRLLHNERTIHKLTKYIKLCTTYRWSLKWSCLLKAFWHMSQV